MVHFSLFDVESDHKSDESIIEEINYLWDYFVSIRGAPLLPTCKEIETLLTWIGQCVPSEIIKKGMDQTILEFEFNIRSPRPGLHRCKREVHRLFRQHLDDEIRNHLSVLTESDQDCAFIKPSRLNFEALISKTIMKFDLSDVQQQENLDDVMKWIDQRECHGKMETPADLEKTLNLLNNRLTKLMLQSFPKEVIADLTNECTKILTHYQQDLPPERFKKVLHTFVVERLRHRHGIKTFSLHQFINID